MAKKRSLAKDFHLLLKNIRGMSGGQAAVTDWEDDLTSIKVIITPSDGYYKGGQFDFEINPPTAAEGEDPDFSNPPRVYCRSRIYHPNIDVLEDDGEICLNLLEDLWTEERNLEDVVQGLLFLMYNPNLEDPLTCIFSPDMSEEEFEENVKISIEGGSIDGYDFPKQTISLKDDDAVKYGEDDVCVRGDPDGAEVELCVEVQGEIDEKIEVNTKEDGEGVISECIDVHVRDKWKEEYERVNDIIECNICDDDDEGTPVDGYPQVQVIDDVKTRKDVYAGSEFHIECGLNNNVVCQRREDPVGEVGAGTRLNFWWGVAIRRVRGWNVFS